MAHAAQDALAPPQGPALGAPPFFAGPFPATPEGGRHVLQMVQHLSTRVQKLERSKGQISKDLSDMLRESQEFNKRIDSDKAGGAHETAVARAPSPPGLPDPGSIQLPLGFQPDLKPDTSGSLQRAKSPQTTVAPMPLPEALQINKETKDGKTVYMVKWRIDSVKSKFKDCIGRPLVSPQFECGELAELRLMVSPNIGIDSASTMRDQKSKFDAVLAGGPLKGALKFKVVGGQDVGKRLLIDFTLFVGGAKSDLMTHNFTDHIIKSHDFNNDWLQEMEHGALTVGVEISNIVSETKE